MKRSLTTAAVLSILISTACVTPKFLPQTPTDVKTSPISLTFSNTLEADNTKAVNDSKDIRYTQNFGGGGVGLGLLLGPIGAAANAAMINSNTEKDVAALKGKFSVDPMKIFQESAKDSSLTFITKPGEKSNISPYIYIVKVSESGKLALAASLLIEYGSGDNKWIARYMYELPVSATLDPATQTLAIQSNNIEAMIQNGYKSILKQLQSETQESVAAEKDIVYMSDFVTPRFQFAVKSKLVNDADGRIWVRTPFGILSLIKEHVKIQTS